MSTHVATDRPLEERLRQIPRDRLRPEARRRLVRLCRGVDRLARLDEESKEVYIDEPSLRKLFGEEFPAEFVDRFVTLMRAQPGSSLRGAAVGGESGRRSGSPMLWETYVRQVVKDVPPRDTFEGLGLTGASTNEDLRDALKPRLAHIPDSFYEPATAGRIRELVDRLAASAREPTAGESIAPRSDPWTSFSQCFGQVVGGNAFFVAWMIFIAVLMVTWNWVAAVAAAAAGLAVWTVIGVIYCVLQSVFG
jgi:hypothetical protein